CHLYLQIMCCFFFFQAEDGIRDFHVTGVQTCALPISYAADKRVRDANPPEQYGSRNPDICPKSVSENLRQTDPAPMIAGQARHVPLTTAALLHAIAGPANAGFPASASLSSRPGYWKAPAGW